MSCIDLRLSVLRALDYTYPKSAADVYHHVSENFKQMRGFTAPKNLSLVDVIEQLHLLYNEDLVECCPGTVTTWRRL
jgi:hypothetical protein